MYKRQAVELADQRFGRGEHVCADPAQQKAGDAQPVYADDKILIGLAEPVKAGLRGKKAVQQEMCIRDRITVEKNRMWSVSPIQMQL